MRISLWAEGERPRDKLLERGAAALSDEELLAVLLRTGCPGCSAVQLARELLGQFDGLGGVLRASRSQLQGQRGVGAAKFALLCASLEMARRQALEAISSADVLSSPQQTRRFLQHHLGAQQREIFSCLFLDSQHRLIRCDDMFLGTLDGAAVYPREVVSRALQYSSVAVIFAHNHPSGDVKPSRDDERITGDLRKILSIMDVRVLDHLIIGGNGYFSFAREGLL